MNVKTTLSGLCLSFLFCGSVSAQIDEIGLQFKTNDPSKVVVIWKSKWPGDSVVRYGLTQDYSERVRIAGNRTEHRVEISLKHPGATYHYTVSSGNYHTPNATFSMPARKEPAAANDDQSRKVAPDPATRLVADIHKGSGDSKPSELTVLNGRLYFRADDGVNGPMGDVFIETYIEIALRADK